jgi:hypothetical protein
MTNPWFRVTGSVATLRLEPDPGSGPVASAAKGDLLEAVHDDTTSAWVCVRAPATVAFWLYADLVRTSAVSVPEAFLRGGPGIEYPIVGRLDRGDRAIALARDGDWLRVPAPATAAFWIERRQTERLPEPATVAAEPVAAAPVPPLPTESEPLSLSPSRPAGLRALPPPSARSDSAAAEEEERLAVRTTPSPPAPVLPEGRAEAVELEGRIEEVGYLWRRPASFRLTRLNERGRTETICFLVSDHVPIEPLGGQKVRVIGRRYDRKPGSPPIVIPDELLPLEPQAVPPVLPGVLPGVAGPPR